MWAQQLDSNQHRRWNLIHAPLHFQLCYVGQSSRARVGLGAATYLVTHQKEVTDNSGKIGRKTRVLFSSVGLSSCSILANGGGAVSAASVQYGLAYHQISLCARDRLLADGFLDVDRNGRLETRTVQFHFEIAGSE